MKRTSFQLLKLFKSRFSFHFLFSFPQTKKKNVWRIMQEKIEMVKQGEIFLCPICNKLKRYFCLGICNRCYDKEHYLTNEKYRESRKNQSKKNVEKGYFKKLYKKRKLGDEDTIKEICRDYGFSDEVSDAIAVDGIVLDDVMKKRKIM